MHLQDWGFPQIVYVLDSSGYGLAAFRVAGALGLSSRFQQRDEGVPRRPGGPPYLGCCCSNHLSEAHSQLPQIVLAVDRDRSASAWAASIDSKGDQVSHAL